MIDLAYVTYRETEYPDDDSDLPLVLAAAAARGMSAEAVIWDEESDWTRFRCAVVRSTWDYVGKYAAFREWLASVDRQTLLFNPRPMIERNLDKTYLRDLGVPIVPTWWIESTDDLHLIERISDPWIVVKPTVSAGARATIRTRDREEARAHASRILATARSVMVQPYLDAVDGEGEISVICIDGEPSWAARKIPALTTGGHGGSKESYALSADLREAAVTALAHHPGSLYARVDMVRHAGTWLVMELELAEPSLFVELGPADAADRLVAAIERRIRD
jgi:hypothetical protein